MQIHQRNDDVSAFNYKKGIYYLYKDSRIVYIGSSRTIGHRIISHRRGKYSKGSCYKKFDSFSFFECGVNEMLELEAIEIFTHTPMYNNGLPMCKYNSNKEYRDKKRVYHGL